MLKGIIIILKYFSFILYFSYSNLILQNNPKLKQEKLLLDNANKYNKLNESLSSSSTNEGLSITV